MKMPRAWGPDYAMHLKFENSLKPKKRENPSTNVHRLIDVLDHLDPSIA